MQHTDNIPQTHCMHAHTEMMREYFPSTVEPLYNGHHWDNSK